MSDHLGEQDSPRSTSFSAQLDEICTRFEAAWKAGQAPRIGDYLDVDLPDDQTVLIFYAWIILAVLGRLQHRMGIKHREEGDGDGDQ